jgi:hypothetical protein
VELQLEEQTPIDTHNKLPKADPDFEPTREEIKWYQKVVGSLMYAMLGTRPDMAFAVSVVSRYAQDLRNNTYRLSSASSGISKNGKLRTRL